MTVAGLGLRSGASSADIVGLLRRAEKESGRSIQLVVVPEFKQQLAALREALSILRLPMITASRARLERLQARCPTQSVAALAATGLASVAEACALAALREGGKLVLPRIATAQTTCAIAIGNPS